MRQLSHRHLSSPVDKIGELDFTIIELHWVKHVNTCITVTAVSSSHTYCDQILQAIPLLNCVQAVDIQWGESYSYVGNG